jgi:hypothetical protein
MTFSGFQPGANLYTLGGGNRPEAVETPHLDTRAPTPQDYRYPVGKRWIFIGNSEWVLLSKTSVSGVLLANWVMQGSTIQQVSIAVPYGTSPVLPTNSGLFTFTSQNDSIVMTGGLNSINFALSLNLNFVISSATSNSTGIGTNFYGLRNQLGVSQTFNLNATASEIGQVVIVKDIGGTAATFNIIISASNSGTIDGSTSPVLINTNYGSYTFIRSNGTNTWSIIAKV